MEYAFRSAMTRFLLVFTVLGLLAGTMWAQGGTGELTGLVTDPSGAVIANAQITLTNSATGETRTTVTTAAGTYRFPALPVVGTYTLETSPKGFKGAKIANIVVSVGTIVNQDVKLELGASTEEVTVEAGVQQVQTQESSLSGLVDRRVWQQMPLETRSQNEFVNLTAGAVSGTIAVGNNNGGTDRGAAVNGSRSGTGNFLVEGFSNNDQGLGGGGSLVGPGGANTTISPDAIQEYRVITHNFNAEYGQAGGFVTDTVLKSGTNQWHGSLFEYNRIQALAAENYFSTGGVRDHLVRNQFGGSIGGPIIKEKSFFYFTTEFHRRRQSTPLTAVSTTPDFLNFVNSGAFETFNETDPNGYCVQVTGSPCAIGSLPDQGHLGPIFQQLQSSEFFPLCTPGAANCKINTLNPGIPGLDPHISLGPWGAGSFGALVTYPVPLYGTLTVNQPDKLDQARYTVKVDHRLGSNDQLSGAYLYDNADETTKYAGGGAGSAGFGVDQPSHGRAMNAGITWTHTFSPSILNQARVAYVRHTANFPGDKGALAAGIPSVFSGFDPLAAGFGNASNLPQFFTENAFQYKDDLSVTKGKHNFKGGAEYRRTRNGSSFQSELNGLFVPYTVEDLVTDFKATDNLDSAFTGGPYYGSLYYAEATVDPTKVPAVRPDYYRGFRANEFGAYFQDDWRILPRLTLNLGVRWDYFGPPHNFISGVDSNYFPGSPVEPTCTVSNGATPPVTASGPCNIQNQFYPVGNPTLQAFATGGLAVRNHEIWGKDTNNFAPRVGFAWDVTGKQKLVMRGGFGIAYDRLYNNVFENIRFNPPFFCFCNFGAFRNGVPGGGNATPGLFAIPFNNQALFGPQSPLFNGNVPKTSPRAIDPNLVTAYYQQTNFGFEYQIAKDLILESDYVGTWGRKLVGIINLNTFAGRRAGGVNPDNPFGSHNATTRPNPNVSNINLRTNGFSSNYNAWQTALRKRFSSGLQFNANYTYAKALDQLSDTFTPRGSAGVLNPTDSLNKGLDYGPADFDVRHRGVVSFNYDLPFLKTNRWLGGWSFSGIFTAQSGVPFSVTNSSSGYDLNKDGRFTDRISYIGPGSITHGVTGRSPAIEYFNPSLFADTVCPPSVNGGLWCEGRSVGQSSRNSLYGPKYINLDFGVAKRFKVTEGSALTFQANWFNTVNRPNFALPTGDANNSNFGRSTIAFDPRVGQLAIRFDF